MKKFILTSFMASTIALTGCATIVGDKTQTLPISSNPDGANFVVQDEQDMVVFRGVTPSKVQLEKSTGKYFGKKEYKITFTKAGYQPQTYQLETKPNGWYIGGNLVFGGLIGYLAVDPFNGGMYTIHPEQVGVSLSLDNSPEKVATPNTSKVKKTRRSKSKK